MIQQPCPKTTPRALVTCEMKIPPSTTEGGIGAGDRIKEVAFEIVKALYLDNSNVPY